MLACSPRRSVQRGHKRPTRHRGLMHPNIREEFGEFDNPLPLQRADVSEAKQRQGFPQLALTGATRRV